MSNLGDRIIDVETGEIRLSSEPTIIQSVALGSCVGLAVYDPDSEIGGLAHIMLPGIAPSPERKNRYTYDAIEALLKGLKKLGANTDNLNVYAVGGGNVLQEGDVPDKVIDSVLECLEQHKLGLKGSRLGGIVRRSVYLDTATGDVNYTEGDSSTRELLTSMDRIIWSDGRQ